ncbi:hypothetical protein EDB83DRAFT_1304426 [Lactarius deliciosus]|nr:hypothetical protein EDB83DRAFT_1304426 [Lactarius deliciosus]
MEKILRHSTSPHNSGQYCTPLPPPAPPRRGSIRSHLYSPILRHPIKHGLLYSVLIKATIIRKAMGCAHEMAGCCGAQRTFYTDFIARQKPTKTESSSPGDVLALCIYHGASSPSATTPHIPAVRARSLPSTRTRFYHRRRSPGPSLDSCGHRSATAEYALPSAIVALGHASAYSIRGEGRN